MSEAGYAELYQLFEVSKAFLGKVPPVIDSDDLVSKPEATVKAYCNAVGIPFLPQALKWESKRSPEINQWEVRSPHAFMLREKSLTKSFKKVKLLQALRIYLINTKTKYWYHAIANFVKIELSN